MSFFHHNGLLVPDGDRLSIFPTRDYSWWTQPGDTIEHDGQVFAGDQYFGEWIALTSGSSQTVCGILILASGHSEISNWIRRRFQNVRWTERDELEILFSRTVSYEQPGWPFLPVSAFASPTGNYVFRVPHYFEEA